MKDFKQVIVNKPWGYEYLVFQTNEVALWMLHIKENEKTSLHCHPQKTTGLILTKGIAELGFIADSKVISAPEKQMIRRGLFHSTKAVSPGGVFMFEIETPNDKGDLVRLNDSYGRSHDGYESSKSYLPRQSFCHWINEPRKEITDHYENHEASFGVKAIDDLNELLALSDHSIVMFLRGGLGKKISNRSHLATVPGDIGRAVILKRVAKEMDFLAPNTLILKVD